MRTYEITFDEYEMPHFILIARKISVIKANTELIAIDNFIDMMKKLNRSVVIRRTEHIPE